MTAFPAESPQPAHPRRSGRRTVLIAAGALVLIVGVLLSGKGVERQLCLRTLEQRERDAWYVGSFRVRSAEWRAIDEWPEIQNPHVDIAAFGRATKTPSEVSGQLWPDGPEHLWTTTKRSMPFALFMQIENPTVMPGGFDAVTEVQRVARTVIAGDTPEARGCLLRIDDTVLDGVTPPEGLSRKERREFGQRPPAAGELAAERLLDGLSQAARAHDADAARAVLCTTSTP